MSRGRGLYITLSQKHLVEADKVGIARRENAIALHRKDSSGLKISGQAAIDADVWAARGELAGKLALDPINWHSEIVDDPTDLPDLSDFIDVKTVLEDRRRLIVETSKVRDKWAYLLVSGETHPEYWVAGWLWGHQIREHKTGSLRSGSLVHIVEHAELAPWFLLKNIASTKSSGQTDTIPYI